MSTQHNHDEQTINLTRRDVMRGAATAGAGAVTLRAADDLGLDLDPVGEAEAGVGVVAGIIGASIVAHAYLNSGSDGKDPEEAADNTQVEQLTEQFYQAAKASKEFNERAILSEDSLIREEGLNTLNGLEQMAYEEGTAAAVDSMNNGATQAQTLTNAKQAAQDLILPSQQYLLDEWQATMDEYINYYNQIITASGTSQTPASYMAGDPSGVTPKAGVYHGDNAGILYPSEIETGTVETVTLIDGSTRDMRVHGRPSQDWYWGPQNVTDLDDTAPEPLVVVVHTPASDDILRYFNSEQWDAVWNKTVTAWENVEAELEKFVNDTYDSWQSGEISKDDFLTSRMLAQQAAEDSSTPRAVADLIGMGAETDLSRKVAISFSEDGVSWQLAGMMAATKSPSGGFEVGQSYVPNSTDDSGNKLIGSVYMACDQENVVGNWPSSGYTTGVDGGIIEITKEPLENYVYDVTTAADETVRIGYADWTSNSNGNWEYDASDRLETPITEVAGIQLRPAAVESGDSQYIRENIDTEFTVEEIINEETGEEFQTVEFEQQTASAPTDYRTAEDFRQQAQRNQELYERMLDRFEEVENSGGGGLLGGGGGGFLNGLPSLPGLGVIESAVVVFLGIAGLNAASS